MDNYTTQLVFMQGGVERLEEIPDASIHHVITTAPHIVDQHAFWSQLERILHPAGVIFPHVESKAQLESVSEFFMNLKNPSDWNVLWYQWGNPLFTSMLNINTFVVEADPLKISRMITYTSGLKHVEVYRI